MRQFAGFGTVEETNERFHYLLDHGQTGLSTAFDMPTLMGYDSDHERSLGEVGREGVAVDTLADMERLFEGIPLGGVTTSMTINAPAAILLAFYVLVGEKQGVPAEKLGGTIQTDILKEYIAQKEWCFPIEPAMRLVTDMIEWCTENMPRWHPVSISGYHIREAGSTAQQELAFTLKDGFTYVERAIERGLDVDDFAPRLSFFFNSHIDFFEEIAKYRAARRIWAREMKETYGATKEESMRLRFHTQTAGVSLTAQQPLNNIVRTALEALAAVMGGTQSLHTNSFDEALALPTEEAVRVALRTQQIIATETGVANTADPLGGSYFVEKLTDEMEAGRLRLLRPDRRAGGDGRGDPPQLPPARDRRVLLPLPAGAERTAPDRRRRQRLRPGRRRGDADPEDRPGAGRQAARPPRRDPRRPRRRRRRGRPGRAEARRRRRGQPDAADHRGGPRPGHRGRDDRRDAGGLRHLHRVARLLTDHLNRGAASDDENVTNERRRPPPTRSPQEALDLRDMVRRLAQEKIAPRAGEIDRKSEYPWDVRELLA